MDQNAGRLVAEMCGHDDGEIAVQNVDQFPYVTLKGAAANLSALRQGDMDLRKTFFQERFASQEEDEADNAPMLLLEPSIQAIIKIGGAIEGISGEIFVTRAQVLFVAKDQDQSDSDIAIGAACIVLHAMMEEPQMAVYLQLNESDTSPGQSAFVFGPSEEKDGTAESNGPLEATIEPVEQDDCQRLFDSLCKLVALHPTEDDEDDTGNFDSDMFGGGDDLIWAPAHASTVSSDGSEGATETERDVMLERLDNLLVVRPEFEVQEGQFDDADCGEGSGDLQ
jgi:hypothetical protein